MRVLKNILFLLLLSFTGFAQELVVRASLDSGSILIGEQVKLKLSAFFTAETDQQVKWPALKDTITSKIEIVKRSAIDTTVTADSKTIYSQELIITSFDSGFHPVPPFVFQIKGDTSSAFETEALLLEVNTVPVDTTTAIRDIKSPVDAPFHWKEALPYIIGGAIALAIIIALILWWKKRKRAQPVRKEPEIIRDPADVALEQIARLKDEKLWQQGRTKEFYIRLSDILRIYIENRFKVPSLEQTTDELLLSIRSILEEEQKSKVRQVLILSDLVKFAKENPVSYENEMSLQNTESFIEETRKKNVQEVQDGKAV